MALVPAWIAGTALVQQARSVDLHVAALRLERGRELTKPAIERRRRDVERLIAEPTCDDQTLRAGITLSLAELDRSNAATDFDRWTADLERSRKLLRRAIACSPHNANFWTRLVLVERAVAASPGRVLPLMAMSARLAPAEFRALQARFQLWRSVARWLPPDATGLLQSDLRTILVGAHLYDIKQMIGGVPALARFVQRELPTLDDDRRAAVAPLSTSAAVSEPKADKAGSTLELLDTPRR